MLISSATPINSLPFTFSSPPTTTNHKWKKEGLKFESLVGKWLEHFAEENNYFLCSHPWFQYNSPAKYAQMDYLLKLPSEEIIIFEVKHTYTPKAWGQLDLYTKILLAAFPQIPNPPYRVQVCKYLIQDTASEASFSDPVISDIALFTKNPQYGNIIWHVSPQWLKLT